MAVNESGGGLKILSFNWHEPYLCLLAQTGNHFFVYEPVISGTNQRLWDVKFRPQPDNLITISAEEMKNGLNSSFFDLIICHNVKDLLTVAEWPNAPKILVFHNKLSTEIALGNNTVDRGQYLEQIKPLLSGVSLVFISESKKRDWGLEGEVIPPGIDINQYGGHTGDLKAILRVGNMLMERDLMLGFKEQVELCSGLPTTLLGDNPRLEESRVSQSWEDLKNHYRKCRVYLNTTKEPYEDGYNLSLLEAMATGMPVVSLTSPTSPVTDGKEGFVGDDLVKLRKSLELLLNDQLLAKTMGEQARKTVAEKFPMDKFISRWNSVINNVAKANVKAGTSLSGVSVWMDYAYYPATTAHYLRRALSAKHKLVTSGPSMPPEVIKIWNLENMKAPILNQDIPRAVAPSAPLIYKALPSGFKPDFFLWVETGLDLPPQGLENIIISKAVYFIDTHLNLENHLNLARFFDHVFLAQKEYIPAFRGRGISNVHWLPLACDPEIHGKRDVPKTCDIGFAGSITPSHQRRKVLLERLQSRFNVRVERVFLEEMAELYSSSRIVFNNAIRRDLNMRVFEALCSGSMLLTDGSVGQEDFFKDREHLVVFNDDNIEELAAYYLAHADEREAIARAGREKVLAEHTYANRVEQIIRTVMTNRVAIDLRKEEPKAYYRSVRTDMTVLVPKDAVRILEVGCAAGETARVLKDENPSREIVGIEYNRIAATKAATILDAVFCGDCERLELPYPPGHFDCILYGDVLEHLRDPEAVLERHGKLLAPDGVMVMSIPNIQHISVLNQLMEGRFTYQAEGLLDRTHLKFFTQLEIEDMLKRVGLALVTMQGKRADSVYRDGSSGTLKVGRWQIDNLTEDEMLRFFVFQYLVVAKKDPRSAAKRDPWDPEVFRNLATASPHFNAKADDPLSIATQLLAESSGTEYQKISKALDGASETHPERLAWLGQLNMAAGRFRQAEEVFRKAGLPKWEGCALAGRGLLKEALALWFSVGNDHETREWFDRYRQSRYSAGGIAMSAVKTGKGISVTRFDGNDFIDCAGNDYFVSDKWLEYQPDIVGALRRIAGTLKPGGTLLALCGGATLDVDTYPIPLHRFSPEGFVNVAFASGFPEITVNEIYPGSMFMAICHKPGGVALNYEESMKQIAARYPAELATYYWERKQYEAAAQSASSALELDPQNPSALCRLGDSLMRLGQAADAEQCYLKAIRTGKGEGPYIGLGTIQLGKNDFTAALGHFEKAIEINPKNDRALTGMGMALAGAGRHNESSTFYRRALETNPENGMALNALVQLCYLTREYAVAERALESYLELHPANLDMLFGLAGVLYAQGKNEGALEAVEKILIFKPEHPDAVMLLEKITGERTT